MFKVVAIVPRTFGCTQYNSWCVLRAQVLNNFNLLFQQNWTNKKMVGCDFCEISRAITSNVKRDFRLQPDYLTKPQLHEELELN